jgi:hypothetical protein
MKVEIKLKYKDTHNNCVICKVVIPFEISGDINWMWISYFGQEVKRYEKREKVNLYVRTTSSSIYLEIPLSVDITKELVLDLEKRCKEIVEIVNNASDEDSKNKILKKYNQELKLQKTIDEIRGLE